MVHKNSKQIDCKNLSNGEILTFNSSVEASEFLKISKVMISQNLNGKIDHVGGYVFKLSTDENFREIKDKDDRRNKVVFSKNVYTHKVEKYNSIKEASKALNISMNSIIKVCKGEKKSVKAYSFWYEELEI